MSTITKDEIATRLQDKGPKRLVITPILSKTQIGDASVDVRLGNQFIVFRTYRLGAFKPHHTETAEVRRIQQRQVIRFGQHFVLHPRMLTLASTFEYICIPGDLECQAEGRSSWARIGLQIATATSVEPGFKGVLTLELSNLGTAPIELFPGVRIAQLFFHQALPEIKQPYGTKRKYLSPVGPQFSRIYNDDDGRVFAEEP